MKILGKHPSGTRLQRIVSCSNYQNEIFNNIEPTEVMRPDINYFTLLREMASRPKDTQPLKPLPNYKTDLKNLSSDKPAVVWFGHSSYLVKSNGFTILVDPVFSGNASPVSFFGKAFKGTSVYRTSDFPDIDLLIITHDHYDHLDYKTMLAFNPKVKQVVCSLGVGAHLEYWGFDPKKITELNWWENYVLNSNVQLTATPARHFTGRRFKRAKTLWSSFVLKINGYSIFVGGDSGYDAQFKKIGETFGPFDLAFLECGQYGLNWPNIHMFPEQTVRAAMDLNVKVLFPVHWGKFALASHSWNESIQRLSAEANKQGQYFVMPLIGQPYHLGDTFEQDTWWL
jgi:L-ascorbate metabolism protein UlaG (beta-lactamase superfamily)